MISTDTFTFGEQVPGKYSFSDSVTKHYCSYCGNAALVETHTGDRSEHYETTHTYYCECDDAQVETMNKKALREAEAEVASLKRKIEDMKKLTKNRIVNDMKFKHEITKLAKTHNIPAYQIQTYTVLDNT